MKEQQLNTIQLVELSKLNGLLASVAWELSTANDLKAIELSQEMVKGSTLRSIQIARKEHQVRIEEHLKGVLEGINKVIADENNNSTTN